MASLPDCGGLRERATGALRQAGTHARANRLAVVQHVLLAGDMSGPPFAVTETDLRSYHGAVELLLSEDVLAANPAMRQRGLSALRENVYLVGLNGA